MSLISIPFTFSAGAVIVAAQHNLNFSTIYSDYNGNIDNNNIANTAAIAYSKLSLSNSILVTDLNSSISIPASNINLTSPGAIGSTAPNTGAFTTLKVGTTHQGDILYDNGTSLIRLTPGTAGQVLITNGAAANPSWGTNGALSLISSTNLSSVSTSGNIAVTSGNQYMIMFNLTGFTAGDQPSILFNADSGAHYQYINFGYSTTGVITNSSASASLIQISRTLASSGSLSGVIYINQGITQVYRLIGDTIFDDNNSSLLMKFNVGATWGNSANMTSFVFNNSNNISGTITLYQVRTS